MINVKKGTGHSLQQTDKVGKVKSGEGVVAGMVVRLNSSGEVEVGVSAADGADLLGFAINNQTDGDVISSNKIGFYQLDGNTVVETDQVEQDITAANFPVGAPVYGKVNDGRVSNASPGSGSKILGVVDSIRRLPSTRTSTQNYVDVDGNTQSASVKIQTSVAVLGIRLGAV